MARIGENSSDCYDLAKHMHKEDSKYVNKIHWMIILLILIHEWWLDHSRSLRLFFSPVSIKVGRVL
jgi:hypothetical protein